jgi:hypothetical protein
MKRIFADKHGFREKIRANEDGPSQNETIKLTLRNE